METSEYLARHHRRVVDQFIESVLCELDLGDLERNVLGTLLRSEVESRLVPGLTAVLGLLLEVDSEVLGEDLPEWLDRVSSVMPADAEFLAEMGRRLDPACNDLLDDNLGLLPGETVIEREFRSHLWEMAPRVPKNSLL